MLEDRNKPERKKVTNVKKNLGSWPWHTLYLQMLISCRMLDTWEMLA